MNKPAPDLGLARKLLQEGRSIGVISEAGLLLPLPDPGQLVVQAAHSINATVVPLVGPNSMLLALMASGMNGQNFQFVGYLPVKPSGARQSASKSWKRFPRGKDRRSCSLRRLTGIIQLLKRYTGELQRLTRSSAWRRTSRRPRNTSARKAWRSGRSRRMRIFISGPRYFCCMRVKCHNLEFHAAGAGFCNS